MENEKEQQPTESVQGATKFSPKTFDLPRTMETVMGSEALFKQIAEMLIESCPVHIAKIREAIAGNDSDTLEREAHSLKGAVGNFSATDAYETAYQLELLGKNGEMATAETGFSNLLSALDELVSEMKIVLRGM